jgi:HSP20 family protein
MADQELQPTEKKEVAGEKGELTHEGIYFTPAVDIFGNENELIVLADMPGVNAESVEIDLREDTLSIVGKASEPGGEGEPLLREYRTGNYFRSFRVTEGIDQAKITATMSDGVLKLVLPKVEKAVPRKIQISTE